MFKDIKTVHGSYPSYYEKIQYHEKPNCLYHYTALEGVKGILESKTLWLTNINTANDSSEGKIILEKIFL